MTKRYDKNTESLQRKVVRLEQHQELLAKIIFELKEKQEVQEATIAALEKRDIEKQREINKLLVLAARHSASDNGVKARLQNAEEAIGLRKKKWFALFCCSQRNNTL